MFIIDDNEILAYQKEAIFIDASGSIDIQLVNKQLSLWAKALMQYSNEFEVHLTCFDNNKVYNILKITKTNIADILSYKVVGGGGSDLLPCWKYMKENNMRHGMVFTDGYLDFGASPGLDIFFVIHSGNTHKPPYGRYGYI